MGTVTINRVAFGYDDSGDGPALLLLHAGIADRRMWGPLVPLLTPRHRVVRIDLRGFGETAKPGEPFAHADDVADVLARLAIERVDLCGVSLGAGVALDLAMRHAALVRHLVLVAPGLPGWDWGEAMHDFDARETAALERNDLDEASWLNVRFWVDGPHRTADEVDVTLRRQVFAMQRRAFELENPDAVAAWLVPDKCRHLPDVAARTLVVVGELDQPEFAAIGRHIAEHIPNARFVLQPGVAHLPPLEDPVAFAPLLLEHLGS